MKRILSGILALNLLLPAAAFAQQEAFLLKILTEVQNSRTPRPQPNEERADDQDVGIVAPVEEMAAQQEAPDTDTPWEEIPANPPINPTPR